MRVVLTDGARQDRRCHRPCRSRCTRTDGVLIERLVLRLFGYRQRWSWWIFAMNLLMLAGLKHAVWRPVFGSALACCICARRGARARGGADRALLPGKCGGSAGKMAVYVPAANAARLAPAACCLPGRLYGGGRRFGVVDGAGTGGAAPVPARRVRSGMTVPPGAENPTVRGPYRVRQSCAGVAGLLRHGEPIPAALPPSRCNSSADAGPTPAELPLCRRASCRAGPALA